MSLEYELLIAFAPARALSVHEPSSVAAERNRLADESARACRLRKLAYHAARKPRASQKPRISRHSTQQAH